VRHEQRGQVSPSRLSHPDVDVIGVGRDLRAGDVEQPWRGVGGVDERDVMIGGSVGRDRGQPAGRARPVHVHGRVPLQDRPAEQEQVEVVAVVLGVQVEVGEEHLVKVPQQTRAAQLPGHAAPAVDQVGASRDDDGLGDPGAQR